MLPGMTLFNSSELEATLSAASSVYTEKGGHAFVSFTNLLDLDAPSKPRF